MNNEKILKKKYLSHVVILTITALTCIGIYFSTLYYEVKVDGKTIGIVKNKDVVYDLVENMKNEIKKDFNKDIRIDGEITFDRVKSSKSKLTPIELIQENLDKTIDLKAKAYAISVNGKDVVFLRDKKSAESTLAKIKKSNFKNNNTKELGFLEKVDIKEKETFITNIKNKDNAEKILLTGSCNKKDYKVQDGDTLWTISKKYNITVQDLQKSNPNINIDEIKINQNINISTPKPYVNVKAIEIAKYEEAIPYQITYEDTDALYKGEKKLKIDGIQGKKKVEAKIVRINGVVSSKAIVKEEVLQNPSNKVVLQGTKQKPLYIAYGVFSNPTRGILTSRFGSRWGKSHTGIDIAGSIGTPIGAADGGTVDFAGKQNGYGNLVIIDHGNGYKTYYGHCSSLNVKKGQKVAKGDMVAKVGNTGRSTGPHLHFEVRLKNNPVNPLKYVNY